MTKLCGWPALAICAAALAMAGGCGEGDGQDQRGSPPPGVAGAPGGAGPGSPGIKQIMIKLAKGPNSLTSVIGNELNQDPPPWETIQGQSKEYAQSAADLVEFAPSKGSKESWDTLSKAFADLAVNLDQAASAKNQGEAKTAHDQIKNSCNACHQQHRQMGPRGGGGPRGGPGGPPPGGPGGPPPGGRGGPPPGGMPPDGPH
jgi:hypothetical protein